MQYDKQYAVLLASAAIFFSSEHKRRSSCLLFPQSCSKSRISWSASLQRRFSSSLFSILKTHAVHTYIFHIHILTFFSLSKFAQELLSTFSTSLGEVALQPSTGGTFVVHLYTRSDSGKDAATLVQKHLLWDRKAEGGFPGTSLLFVEKSSLRPLLLCNVVKIYLPRRLPP